VGIKEYKRMLTKRSKFDIEDLEEIPGVAERLEEAKEIRKKYNKNIYSVIKSEVKS
jgi:DNA repair ATPase RecN